MTRQRIAVVGRGLIGSAAARHLALAGHAPLLIGPAEPADKRAHHGVFGSHYDEGRITRKVATDRYWAEAAIASIARYAEIEAQSGIRFYSPVGATMAGPDTSQPMNDARSVVSAAGIAHEPLDRAGMTEAFPDLAVPDDWAALWEPDTAGHISPRRLVAAQTRAAVAAGARVVDAAVDAIEETAAGVRLRTGAGEIEADAVLVAAGGMTDHVLRRTPAYRVYGRTVALFALSEAEASRLAYLPSLILYTPQWHYLLPPIRYPDGRMRMKIGGEADDLRLHSPAEIGDWFRSGGRPQIRDMLDAAFRDFFPSVAVEEVSMDACMTTFAEEGRPEIAMVSDRIAVASAGHGAAAKSSDEFGRRGAALLAPEINERKTA